MIFLIISCISSIKEDKAKRVVRAQESEVNKNYINKDKLKDLRDYLINLDVDNFKKELTRLTGVKDFLGSISAQDRKKIKRIVMKRAFFNLNLLHLLANRSNNDIGREKDVTRRYLEIFQIVDRFADIDVASGRDGGLGRPIDLSIRHGNWLAASLISSAANLRSKKRVMHTFSRLSQIVWRVTSRKITPLIRSIVAPGVILPYILLSSIIKSGENEEVTGQKYLKISSNIILQLQNYSKSLTRRFEGNAIELTRIFSKPHLTSNTLFPNPLSLGVRSTFGVYSDLLAGREGSIKTFNRLLTDIEGPIKNRQSNNLRMVKSLIDEEFPRLKDRFRIQISEKS